MSLTTIIAAAILAITPARAEEAQKEIAFANRPIEYRACPPDSEYNKPTELANGKAVTSIPSRFCYEEPARPFIYEERNNTLAMVTAKVYYTEEGKIKRDAWSTRNGYPSTTRQFIITYEKEAVNYELWFMTNPHADGRGFGDREGGELMVFTREKIETINAEQKNNESGITAVVIHDEERNKYVWMHKEYGEIEGKEENSWQSDAFHPMVGRIMRFMRRHGYQAHRALKGYSIDYNPDRIQNPDPILFTDNDVSRLYQLTEKLYTKAEKIEKRKEEKERRKAK